MKKNSGWILFLLALHSSVFAQEETSCSEIANIAWEGDTNAVFKFVCNCGIIDTVSYDEHNKVVKEKPQYQKISMRLKSGKVLRTDSVYFVAQIMPQFPGGDMGLIQYLKNNIKYPKAALDSSITGTLYVKFIIERDGSVSQVKVLRGLCKSCNEEAIRVVKQMPKWTSGKMHEKPVRVQYNLPVRFARK
ncbi:MAG: energy transducer TonB [Bacteroidia bacterium]